MKEGVGISIIERVDRKMDSGWFCMKLVELLGASPHEQWEKAFAEARKGNCPYRGCCPVYKRTVERQREKDRCFFFFINM